MAKAVRLWRAEPRVEMVDHAPDKLTVRFIQRTALLKFPDTITVQFYPLAETRSTLAIYSRSQIGYHDMGANEARVLHWLSLLQQKLSTTIASSGAGRDPEPISGIL